MPPTAHHLRRLRLQVHAADPATGQALSSHFEAGLSRRLAAVVAAVCEELGAMEEVLRLDRLDLQLGAFTLVALEREAPLALERALREALLQALATARHNPGPGQRLLTPQAARLERFVTFLRLGVLPYRTESDAFAPADDLLALLRDDPAALLAALRRLAGEPSALERLVLQLDPERFARLLDALAPDDAGLILSYLADLLVLHQQRRLLPVAPEPLRRGLWLVTLTLLLRDPGTPFNRRTFLDQLLRGLAAAHRLSHSRLLRQLEEALHLSRRVRPLGASLPALLAELLGLRRTLAPALAVASRDPEPLLALLRADPANPELHRALESRLSGRFFSTLVRAIEPGQAPLVLATVADVALVHRQQPLVPLAPDPFERLVRRVALQWLLMPSGSPFERLSFLRQLLRHLAQSQRLVYGDLLRTFAAALSRLPRPLPLHTSLPALLESLIATEMADGASRDAWRHGVTGVGGGGEEGAVGRVVADASGEGGMDTGKPAAASPVAGGGKPLAGVGEADRSTAGAVERPGPAPEPSGVEPRRAAPDGAGAAGDDVTAATETAFPRAVAGREEPWRVSQRRPRPPFAVELWEPFLRAGHPTHLGLRLQEAVERDPASFAALLRSLLAALPTATEPVAGAHADPRPLARSDLDQPLLLARLLRWLPPDALAAIAAAAAPEPHPPPLLLARWAEWLADAPGADLATAWSQLLPRRLADPSAPLPPLPACAAEHLDRLALLRAWLGLEAPPPWRTALAAEPPAWVVPLLRGASELDLRRLLQLSAAEPEALLLALRRLQAPLLAAEPTAGVSSAVLDPGGSRSSDVCKGLPFAPFLECLLPWLRQPTGPLAEALATTTTAAERHAVGLRAVALALAGGVLTLAELRRPLPPLPPPPFWGGSSQGALGGTPAGAAAAPTDAAAGVRVDRAAKAVSPPSPTWEGMAPASTLPSDSWPDGSTQRPAAVSPSSSAVSRQVAPDAAVRPPTADAPAGSSQTSHASSPGASPALPLGDSPASSPGAFSSAAPGDALAPTAASVGAAAPSSANDRQRLLVWLTGEGPEVPEQLPTLLRLFARLADQGDAEVLACLRQGAGQSEPRRRWRQQLPEALLGRVVLLLQPGRGRLLLDLQALLCLAWRQARLPGDPPTNALPWDTLLPLCVAPRPLPIRLISQQLLEALCGGGPHHRSAAERLLRHARHLASAAGVEAATTAGLPLLAALEPPSAAPVPNPAAPPADAPDSATPRVAAFATAPPSAAPHTSVPMAPPLWDEPAEHALNAALADGLYIANAGLVLFNPFLPRFFERLGVLTPASDNRPPVLQGVEARSRAVHLLQWLVDERLDAPEPDLALNKVLAGLDWTVPILPSHPASDDERAIASELLEAVIHHWPPLVNTSIAGLRETFLRREGRLKLPSLENNQWSLVVQRRTVDVLMDRMPWPITPLRHRWMAAPLHVTW
ncbi:MAG: contractile injection system tape measure protein [Cyanobacteriota bacterium]|nr:contractile injection system tape measure protein [Cyanobacteriota bacterium]